MNDTKPFDLAAAKAGAPYACRDGQEATVTKFDGRDTRYPLVGHFGENDQPAHWMGDGRYATPHATSPLDLVMLPLGYIDGKPVFVGDEYEFDGTRYRAVPDGSGGFEGCRWPEPAKRYPQTKMTDQELYAPDSLRATANAALRHAIDNGYAATKEAYDQCSRDLEKAERLLEALGYRSAGNGEWEARDCAARDIAIAEAVRGEALRIACRNSDGPSIYDAINRADLSAIIAKAVP